MPLTRIGCPPIGSLEAGFIRMLLGGFGIHSVESCSIGAQDAVAGQPKVCTMSRLEWSVQFNMNTCMKQPSAAHKPMQTDALRLGAAWPRYCVAADLAGAVAVSMWLVCLVRSSAYGQEQRCEPVDPRSLVLTITGPTWRAVQRGRRPAKCFFDSPGRACAPRPPRMLFCQVLVARMPCRPSST